MCLLLQLSGLLLDDRELGVDPLEAFIAVLVGLGKVGCNVGVWCAEVRLNRYEESLVGLVDERDGLGAVWVLLVVLDGVGDNRV